MEVVKKSKTPEQIEYMETNIRDAIAEVLPNIRKNARKLVRSNYLLRGRLLSHMNAILFHF